MVNEDTPSPRKDTYFVSLLQRMTDGDERAAEEFVQHYAPLLRMVIKKRLQLGRPIGFVYDVGDGVQDSFKSFWRIVVEGLLPEDLDNDAKLTAYLKQLARFKAAKACRAYTGTAKRDVRRHKSLDDGDPKVAALIDPSPDPAEMTEKHELLKRALASLSFQERLALHLHSQRRPFREIAEELDCSEETARRTVFRLLLRLSDVSRDHEYAT